MNPPMNPKLKLEQYIDHTLLKPEATPQDVERLCSEARTHRFYAVCVNPIYIPQCRELLRGTDVKVAAVVGFPLGAMTSTAKAFETKEAVAQGAHEIDMVLSVGRLRAGLIDSVREDIRSVVNAAGKAIPVKVILETGLLTQDQKIVACRLAKEAGAAFVKTSTGFGPGGATVEDIRLMRETVGPEMGVKASGGVRTTEQAWAVIEAGATRIGASASVAIVSGDQPAASAGY